MKSTEGQASATAPTIALATALALSLGAPAAAYVSGGHEYDLSCNGDGYVLTSQLPVTREVGQGAATDFVKGREKIYLGRSCDAFHPLYGGGRWCWANGGFRAEFPKMSFGFARQELYCAADESLGSECLCP